MLAVTSFVDRDFKCGALELEGNYGGFTLGFGVVKVGCVYVVLVGVGNGHCRKDLPMISNGVQRKYRKICC